MSDHNPYVGFLFYAGAILFGMFYSRTAFWGCSILWAAAYCALIKGKKTIRLLAVMALLFAGITLINPLFYAQGETILFTYLNGRPYTWEGVQYGMETAGVFCSILLWFSTYQEIMTREKLDYIFGKIFPAGSLVLIMAFRLIADYQKKIRKIESARRGIGKSGGGFAGNSKEKLHKKQRLHNASLILSAMSSWALENSIEEADSMKSRGYGTGRKTHFALYTWNKQDVLLTILLAALAGTLLLCSALHKDTLRLIAYNLFLAIPVALRIAEELRWYILRSKI